LEEKKRIALSCTHAPGRNMRRPYPSTDARLGLPLIGGKRQKHAYVNDISFLYSNFLHACFHTLDQAQFHRMDRETELKKIHAIQRRKV
jgi:hypothetical protein